MTERDIKLLWGRSGNRCAMCRIELSQDKKLSSDKYPLGEQAHIVGDKETAARGESNLSEEERDGYSNRILLCPNHHTEIDRDKNYYSVERLHFVKQNHELWVQERLSERTDTKKQAEELIYSSLIDATVKLCHFQRWNSWVDAAAGSSYMLWDESLIDDINKFESTIFRTAWPKSHCELENALKTLSSALIKALNTFMEHSKYDLKNDQYHEVQFYKLIWHEDQRVYHSLLTQYEEWKKKCSLWLWISTQAANWLSDVVRRDINPLFFAVEGRFVFDRFYSGKIPEFTDQEKATLPAEIEKLSEKYGATMFRSAS